MDFHRKIKDFSRNSGRGNYYRIVWSEKNRYFILARKLVSEISKELDLPSHQVMAIFNRIINHFHESISQFLAQ